MQVTCLNCGTQFEGNFCPQCGQKHGPAMPTTREIVGDLLRSAFTPSGRMVETLRTLVFKPGEVTRAYLAGQRERYVHPVRVYLLGIFVFVIAVGINNTIREWNGKRAFEIDSALAYQSAETIAAKTEERKKATDSAAHNAGKAIGKTMKDSLPPWLQEQIKARAKRSDNLSVEEIEARAVKAMTKNYSLFAALLLPLMALFNWILYAGRGISYAGHFVFVLHATAAGSLLLALPYVVNLPIAYYPLAILSMIWAILAARGAFGVSFWGALWRYVIYIVPTMLLSGLIGATMALLVVLFGN
ncbi:MAG: DUF3667 domain-containing protein [Casimicrobium sp.]